MGPQRGFEPGTKPVSKMYQIADKTGSSLGLCESFADSKFMFPLDSFKSYKQYSKLWDTAWRNSSNIWIKYEAVFF